MSATQFDDEMLEAKLSEVQYVKDILGMTIDKYREYKENVRNGFLQFGTDFQKALAAALNHGELKDSVKILHFWQNDCVQADIMFKIHKAKEDATVN